MIVIGYQLFKADPNNKNLTKLEHAKLQPHEEESTQVIKKGEINGKISEGCLQSVTVTGLCTSLETRVPVAIKR